MQCIMDYESMPTCTTANITLTSLRVKYVLTLCLGCKLVNITNRKSCPTQKLTPKALYIQHRKCLDRVENFRSLFDSNTQERPFTHLLQSRWYRRAVI